MKKLFCIFSFALLIAACKNNKPADTEIISTNESAKELDTNEVNFEKGFTINPVEHASMVLSWDKTTLYIDPVGGAEMYSKYAKPTLIIITDIHGDHLDIPTLEAIVAENTSIIAPQAVFEKLPKSLQNKTEILKNGAKTTSSQIEIEGIAMYNLRPDALKFHEKGRGNGYVLEKNGKRVYISGDTEDIPEMRNLKNIHIAFVCMNLPYTMTVEKAADAVLDFKPKTVYPYHYRGTEGLSDVAKFKSLVEAGATDIESRQLDWYAN